MATISSATTSSPAPALSSPGIGSGLDVAGIVSKLMTVEQQPLTAMQQQEAAYTTKLTALGQIGSTISSFQSAAQALQSASASLSYKLSSSDTSITGSASANATSGTYSVSVTHLAQSQALVAAGQASPTATIGGGGSTAVTLTFGTISGGTLNSANGTYTGASFTADPAKTSVTINIDNSNNTLQGIADAINAANAGVTAAIVNDGSGTPYRLTLTSNATGSNSSLKIDVTGDATLANLLAYDPAGTQNLSQTRAAQDAALNVNGIDVTSPSNTVTDAIPGATLNLSSNVSNATITVQQDTSGIQSALARIVSAYNSVNSTISQATGKAAILQGDSLAVGVQDKLRSALGAMLTGTTTQFTSLSQLGVTFQKDGSLAFDPTKLQSALSTSSTDVLATVKSFGDSLTSLAGNFIGSGGLFQSRTDGLNSSIKEMQNRETQMQQRLTDIEARYRAQFSALDAMIGSMQQTSTYLTQQLNNLPKISG